jgi:hypothetical protein
MKGVGRFTHADPDDRPASVFACRNTLHVDFGKMPNVLLPEISE